MISAWFLVKGDPIVGWYQDLGRDFWNRYYFSYSMIVSYYFKLGDSHQHNFIILQILEVRSLECVTLFLETLGENLHINEREIICSMGIVTRRQSHSSCISWLMTTSLISVSIVIAFPNLTLLFFWHTLW